MKRKVILQNSYDATYVSIARDGNERLYFVPSFSSIERLEKAISKYSVTVNARLLYDIIEIVFPDK